MKNCFIIVNYNDYKSTKHLVDNIKDYNIIDEIVIVDNNSSSKEKELLNKITHKNLKIIWNDTNTGYSNAINIGSRYLIDKYGKCNLIISNSDVVIMCEEDLIRLINLLNDETIGLVGPQIMERGEIIKGSKDISVNLEIMNNINFLQSLISESKYYYDNDYYDGDYSIVDVVNSSFFLISSETMKLINFMDENVFLYYEDYILSKKVRNNGLLVVVSNNVRIKHLYSVSVDKNIKDIRKLEFIRNSQYYYHTTYHKTNFIQRRLLRYTSKFSLVNKKF